MSSPTLQALTSPDGLKIMSYQWLPSATPSFGLFICHGHGEHIGMYRELVEAVQKLPCAVFGVDYRGHGQSDGLRGHAMSISELVGDLKLGLEAVKKDFPQLPLVLFGHSMGGGVLARLLCDHSGAFGVKGAILSSPLLSPKLSNIQKLQMVVAKTLSPLLPKLLVPANHDLSMLSTEPEAEASVKADSLFHTQISLALGADFSRNGAICLERAQNVQIPVLIYWGTEDIFVKVDMVESFYQKLQGTKQKQIFQGVRHAPHMAAPAEREKVFQLLRDTIQSFTKTR